MVIKVLNDHIDSKEFARAVDKAVRARKVDDRVKNVQAVVEDAIEDALDSIEDPEQIEIDDEFDRAQAMLGKLKEYCGVGCGYYRATIIQRMGALADELGYVRP